jgi:uncharacterized protein YndB with AHSA1/START domain
MDHDIELSVELAATCSQVWSIIGDPLSDPLWCPRVLDAEQVSGAEPGPGARYRSRHRPVPGPASMQIVEIVVWEPPHRRLTTSLTPDGVLSVEYELRDTEHGCLLTERDTFSLKRSRRPARRVFLAVKRRRIRQQFDQLAGLLPRARPSSGVARSPR